MDQSLVSADKLNPHGFSGFFGSVCVGKSRVDGLGDTNDSPGAGGEEKEKWRRKEGTNLMGDPGSWLAFLHKATVQDESTPPLPKKGCEKRKKR